MDGTALASFPWRPAAPNTADRPIALLAEPLRRCEDATETVIVVTVAAMSLAGTSAAP